MIYFLYGPDTYSSRAKLRAITAAFLKKAGASGSGGLGFTRVDAGDNPAAALAVGRTRSLFAEKEFIIIERVSQAPAAVAAHLEGQLECWADDANVVVFWEEAVGAKKSPLIARILARAEKSQEFKSLPPAAVSRWLDDEARSRGVSLAPAEKRALLSLYGADFWALSNELEKIRHGWSPRPPDQASPVIWDFTDAFLRSRPSAYPPLARLLGAGFDAIPLAASLGGALRTAAIVWAGIRSGRVKTLTRRLHPFVVKKNMGFARRTDGPALRRHFGELVLADVELKTGRPPSPLPLVKLVLRK
ncbi:MAG: hypothetical protein Q8R35_03255 [bacterium]|nr:hypothetical protein [bacterium]